MATALNVVQVLKRSTSGVTISIENAQAMLEKYEEDAVLSLCWDMETWFAEERRLGNLHSEQSILAELGRRRKALPVKRVQPMIDSTPTNPAIEALANKWRKQVKGGWEPPFHLLSAALDDYGFFCCTRAINQTAGKYEREDGQMTGFQLEQYFMRSAEGYAAKRDEKQRHIPTQQYGYDDYGTSL